MGYKAYDEYAEKYDVWFLKNENVLASEVSLVASCLKDAGRVLSIGCGSGLFEMILKKDYDIAVREGVEPSEAMASIARKRGMKVFPGTAEEIKLDKSLVGAYDTLLFNGCPCYINDLQGAFDNTRKYLRKGGKVVVIDIPKESSYAMLYNLAMTLGTWDHELLRGACPPNPYPIEFVKMALWRTTDEKVECLRAAGYDNFSFRQTLTADPHYSDNAVEEPVEGYERGSYVAISAIKL